jgi:hypothetical protein
MNEYSFIYQPPVSPVKKNDISIGKYPIHEREIGLARSADSCVKDERIFIRVWGFALLGDSTHGG